MRNNGYISVDFKQNDILGENISITGVFKSVENAFNSGKMVYCVNAKYDGMNCSPIPVFITKANEKKYFCSSSILQIVVNDDDTIIVNNLVTMGE